MRSVRLSVRPTPIRFSGNIKAVETSNLVETQRWTIGEQINSMEQILTSKGRNPHRRTSRKLVGNTSCELVAN